MENLTANHPAVRSKWIAGLMTLLSPGMGQIYNGQPRKTFIFVFSAETTMALYRSHMVLWGKMGALIFLYGVSVLLWLWVFLDAVLQAKNPRLKARYNRWYIYLVYFLILPCFVTGAAIFFRMIATVEPYKVPANSMAPSIPSGDRVMVDLLAFHSKKPMAGDLAVFQFPKDKNINYIKRVIAIEGDRVQIKGKVLFINEKEIKTEKLDDPTLMLSLNGEDEDKLVLTLYSENLFGYKHPVFYNMATILNSEFGPVTVPEGKYFVLGDNRDKSSDSRFWGFVPIENFIGKPRYVYFSTDPSTGKIRWDRIGKDIY